MFAIFLSDKMDPFYQNITTFPTVFFTFFLLLTLMFWLVAVLGLVDINFLDVLEIDGDFTSLDEAGAEIPNGVAGLVLKLGLDGVPMAMVLTLISIFGWFFSYYGVYFLQDLAFMVVPISWGVYLLIWLVSLAIAVKLTALSIKPLRPLFKKMQKHTVKVLLGKVAIVRSSKVDASNGEAKFDDGEAGLILKVRTNGESYKLNDRVVLYEYKEDKNQYIVISEEEYQNKLK